MSLKEYCFEDKLECGVDEAGRGPFLGRIYAGAVIWPRELDDGIQSMLTDSKKLTSEKRYFLREYIEKNAIDWAVSYIEPEMIDKIGINNANQIVMSSAIDKLKTKVDMILVDGNRFTNYIDDKGKTVPHTCIIKGDSKYYSIAAASILAKVYHDEYIHDIIEETPMLHQLYDIGNNMGYGTSKHIRGLLEYGPCKYHRKTFIKKYNNGYTIF